MKLMVMSYNFPPVCKASANVAGSLFSDWGYSDYFIVRGNESVKGNIIDEDMRKNCKQFVCDMPPFLRSRSFKIWLPVYLEHIFLPILVYKLSKVIRHQKPEAILLMFPTHFYAMAAYCLVRRSKLPLFSYFVDEWKEMRPHRLQRLVAKYFEPRVIKRSNILFCMTGSLTRLYQLRYPSMNSDKFLTLELPTELKLTSEACYKPIDSNSLVTICYTGAIYDSQQQALQNLVRAIQRIESPKICLQLYTFQSPEVLASMGIKGDFVQIGKTTRSKVLEIQRQADILFLPMSFSENQDIVTRVSIPSKLLEYITTSRPILVHASKETFIGEYTYQNGFGYLVHENSPELLADKLLELINDPILQEKLVLAAKALHNKHYAPNLQARLYSSLTACWEG